MLWRAERSRFAPPSPYTREAQAGSRAVGGMGGERAGGKAVLLQAGDDFLHVLGIAGLQHHVDVCPLGRHDIEQPLMIRSEEHTSELQSLMRNSYAVFCLK